MAKCHVCHSEDETNPNRSGDFIHRRYPIVAPADTPMVPTPGDMVVVEPPMPMAELPLVPIDPLPKAPDACTTML